jgi:methionine-rich copper-binding protein CopC
VFAKGLPAGRYTVSWRVRADDGDSQKGSFRFHTGYADTSRYLKSSLSQVWT